MSSSPKRWRLRIRAPRWPSTNYRDYLTSATARRSGRLTAIVRPAALEVRPDRVRLLGAITAEQRDNAVVRVELRASYATCDGGSPEISRSLVGEASVGAAPDRLVILAGEGPKWTVTLGLN